MMSDKKLKPITTVPPLVVDSIEKFEQEMESNLASQRNAQFLSECRRVYNKHKF